MFGRPDRVYGPTGNVDSQLTPRWYPLIPHPEQMRLINSSARFKVVPAGRRSGKSERAKRNLIIQALRESVQGTWMDYRYFAAAPTRDQAKGIFWPDLKAMVPKHLLDGQPRESDLSFKLITGAEIVVVGLDRPARLEGRSWNGGVIDEIANVKQEAWGENIRPTLSDRNGWCWLIGVPEGRGAYHEMYQYATSGVDPEWDGFSWISADILPEKEIASARRTLDPLVFQQEYEASFVTFEGRAYHTFDSRLHCKQLKYNYGTTLNVMLDFNVEPGVAAIAQEQTLPNGLEGTAIIGEVHIPRNSNTSAVCRKLAQDWGEHKGRVVFYGDATGGSRGSAKLAGSDWEIVKNELRPVFGDRMSFRVPNANPTERARLNAVNSRFLNAAGEVRMMIDPARAPNVIKDFDGVRLLKGGSGEIDKKSDPHLSHLSDSVGYYIFREFPITNTTAKLGNFKI